jgi:cAMP phosphodiesterase
MRVRVLGCHGGESPSHRPSSFLVGNDLLLDTGAAPRSLSLAEQAGIDYVVLTHSHLDHVLGLPLLLDNVLAARQQPVEVFSSSATADALEQHLFNGLLWPDFTKLPSPDKPALRIRRLSARQTVTAGGFELTLIPVSHTVETHAVVVAGKWGSLLYSGDTGPTQEVWKVASTLSKLRAIICEVSMPNAMESLARMTGHLTPRLLAAELRKYTPATNAPVYVTHVKPALEAQVRTECVELGDPRIKPLRTLEELEL